MKASAMKDNYKKGFTLLEMLVVVSIIGILAALILANLASTRERARDATRQSDIKQYQTALGQYASENTGLYPVRDGAAVDICYDNPLWGTDMNLTTCIDDPQAVSDPLQRYKYVSNSGGTEYAVWAQLENSEDIWILCSNGLVGEGDSSTPPESADVCPL